MPINDVGLKISSVSMRHRPSSASAYSALLGASPGPHLPADLGGGPPGEPRYLNRAATAVAPRSPVSSSTRGAGLP